MVIINLSALSYLILEQVLIDENKLKISLTKNETSYSITSRYM